MSKKRGRSKQQPVQVQAVPEEVLAEGSGPVSGDASSIIGQDEVLTEAADQAALEATGDEVTSIEESAAGRGELSADEAERSAEGAEAVLSGDETELSADEAELSADGELYADGERSADGEASDDAELSADGEHSAEGGEAIEVVDGEVEGDAEVEGATMPITAASMDPVQLKQLVEALVFAADKPITVQRLRQLTRVSDVRRLEEALAQITTDYAERGLVLQQVSGGFQFRTRPQFSAWVQQLIAGRPVRLSRAQLETLAIVAYRQPITRPEIDDIRGVDSSATLKLLMDRLLIRVLGKKEEAGRPMLYGTTREFLDFFSLGDLRELPTLREYSELSDESRKVMSNRLGLEPGGGEGGGGGGETGGGGGESDGGDEGGGGEGGGGGDTGGGDSSGGFGDDGGILDNGGDAGGEQINARSLSDLAEHVLARDASASDDETTMFADRDDADEAAFLAEAPSDDASSDDASSDDEAPAMSNDDSMSAVAPFADASMSTDDEVLDETVSIDAETRQVAPILVEQAADPDDGDEDSDLGTRDLDPVTETMTLADVPDLDSSATRIVDPLIAAEVLAHAETIVSSSGESPE